MSTHAKMNADYLWVRPAPIEQAFRYKTHGHIFTYDHAPNTVERMEMIYRSMGKTYDWELEKFRLARKPNDKGNKRRFFRNVFRFVKHPLAYISWASARWYQGWRARSLPTIVVLAFLAGFFEWRSHTSRILSYDEFLLRSGKNIEGMSGRYRGYHNTKPLRGPSFIEGMLVVPIQYDQVVLSDAWKQNLRK